MMIIGNILQKNHIINTPKRFLSLCSEMKSIKEDLQKKGANEGSNRSYIVSNCEGFWNGL